MRRALKYAAATSLVVAAALLVAGLGFAVSPAKPNPAPAVAKPSVLVYRSVPSRVDIPKVGISSLAASSQASVSPTGDDATCTRFGTPCQSLVRGYEIAQSGDVVSVAAGSYPTQVIPHRNDLANSGLPPVVLSIDGRATIGGELEIHGNDLTVAGNGLLDVTGYIDTEADSNTSYPDHVTVQDAHATSFGVFDADTVNFLRLDVGPATIHWYPSPAPNGTCGVTQGPGIENKIGFAGGSTFVPKNVVLDGLHIHDQNGDASRLQAPSGNDCHFGGLFLVTANGLTIKNTVFDHNVVYHVQIQNFGGAPAPTNVTFANDSFGCPVDWLYNGAGCDGQASIQFDGTFPGISITSSLFASGPYGCFVGTCDYSGDTISGNTEFPDSPTAPALGTTSTTTTPTTTTTPAACRAPVLGWTAATDQTITVTWPKPQGALSYRLYKGASATSLAQVSTATGTASSAKFGRLAYGDTWLGVEAVCAAGAARSLLITSEVRSARAGS